MSTFTGEGRGPLMLAGHVINWLQTVPVSDVTDSSVATCYQLQQPDGDCSYEIVMFPLKKHGFYMNPILFRLFGGHCIPILTLLSLQPVLLPRVVWQLFPNPYLSAPTTPTTNPLDYSESHIKLRSQTIDLHFLRSFLS